jgi:hypothetical protein
MGAEVNFKPKWFCPTCKKWVKERLNKRCKKCQKSVSCAESAHQSFQIEIDQEGPSRESVGNVTLPDCSKT